MIVTDAASGDELFPWTIANIYIYIIYIYIYIYIGGEDVLVYWERKQGGTRRLNLYLSIYLYLYLRDNSK